MLRIVACLLAAALLAAPAQGAAMRAIGGLPLGEELGLRMLSRSLAEARASEPRLALPSPAELDALAKVAQVLVMLGQQVIPAIIGAPPAPAAPADCEVPNDPVKE